MNKHGGLDEMTSGLLDVEEGAEFCHIKSTTIRAWILKGKIPFVKLGRRVFLRRADLEQLIEQSVVPARAQSPVLKHGKAGVN